jgi:TfoX/Sxy family transcriptional regulator of competence genes
MSVSPSYKTFVLEQLSAEFERLGAQPFRPFGDDSHVMQYYELPADVLEDRAAVRPWVDRALGAARRKAPGKRRRPKA